MPSVYLFNKIYILNSIENYVIKLFFYECIIYVIIETFIVDHLNCSTRLPPPDKWKRVNRAAGYSGG